MRSIRTNTQFIQKNGRKISNLGSKDNINHTESTAIKKKIRTIRQQSIQCMISTGDIYGLIEKNDPIMEGEIHLTGPPRVRIQASNFRAT